MATVPDSELYLLCLQLSLAVCCGTEDDVIALLFLLAGLPAVFLKGSISPDGDRMWSHETKSAQLRGAMRADSLTTIKPFKINKNTTLENSFADSLLVLSNSGFHLIIAQCLRLMDRTLSGHIVQ